MRRRSKQCELFPGAECAKWSGQTERATPPLGRSWTQAAALYVWSLIKH